MSGRKTFWLIWLLALAPMAAAFVMYFGQVGVPDGRTHHGELVADGTQADALGLPMPDSVDPNWQVVLASDASCGDCRTFSEGLANFHTALGRERNRVTVSEVSTPGATTTGPAIWIIDPLGNVVLRFEPSVNPTLILNDLKKLLKLSKVG